MACGFWLRVWESVGLTFAQAAFVDEGRWLVLAACGLCRWLRVWWLVAAAACLGRGLWLVCRLRVVGPRGLMGGACGVVVGGGVRVWLLSLFTCLFWRWFCVLGFGECFVAPWAGQLHT